MLVLLLRLTVDDKVSRTENISVADSVRDKTKIVYL